MYEKKEIGIALVSSQCIMQDADITQDDWVLTLKPLGMNSWAISTVGAFHNEKVGYSSYCKKKKALIILRRVTPSKVKGSSLTFLLEPNHPLTFV